MTNDPSKTSELLETIWVGIVVATLTWFFMSFIFWLFSGPKEHPDTVRRIANLEAKVGNQQTQINRLSRELRNATTGA